MSARRSKFVLVLPLLTAYLLAGWVPGTAGATTYDLPATTPGSITATTGPGSTVTVPIRITGFNNPTTVGVVLFTVSVQLSSGLKFSPNANVAISSGDFLNNQSPVRNITIVPTIISSTQVTYDCTVSPCITAYPSPSTATTDVLFNLVVGTTLLTGNSAETVSINPAAGGGPILRDCNQTNLAISCGICTVPIQVALCGPVGPPTNLTATPVKSGNGNTPPGIAGIRLDWQIPGGTPAGATMDIWRAPFGFERPTGTGANPYPEYDDDNLFIAQPPATPTGHAPSAILGWTKVGTSPLASALTFTDKPPARGFWYYVVIFTDPCNLSLVSNMTAGTLDYLLGDMNGVAGVGDNTVNAADASALGAAYGATPTAANAYLDFGPTETHTPDGLPHPDDLIGFDDLIIYSMNFNKGPSPQLARVPAATPEDALELEAPASVRAGETFSASLRLRGAGDLQGVSAQLGWDAAVADPVAVESGGMVESQDGLLLSAGPGNVDVAVMGRDRPGLSGEGVLATVSFRAKATGNPHIGIASVDARDQANKKVDLLSPSPSSPIATALAPASPNPFKRASTFGFSLARSGPAELAIFSVDGRRVKTLFAGTRGAGAYRVAWDGTDDAGRTVPSGLFFARLATREGRFTCSVVRVK